MLQLLHGRIHTDIHLLGVNVTNTVALVNIMETNSTCVIYFGAHLSTLLTESKKSSFLIEQIVNFPHLFDHLMRLLSPKCI